MSKRLSRGMVTFLIADFFIVLAIVIAILNKG
jgi:hypothetical protein